MLYNGQNVIELIQLTDNEALRESIGWLVGILLILSSYLGIVDLLQKDNKKGFAVAGLTLDAIAILILGLVLFVF